MSAQCCISCTEGSGNKFDPVIKMVKVNPGSSFEKKPQGMGIQPHGTSSGRDTFLMKTERSYRFDHWLHVSKNSSALCLYAHFLYMYIAPVLDTQNFRPVAQKLKFGPQKYFFSGPKSSLGAQSDRAK